jgi:hypothetical protein
MTSAKVEGMERCLSERGVIEAENPVLLISSRQTFPGKTASGNGEKSASVKERL